ncbi:MAG: ribosomal protein L7/L12 [Mollicutes bacterium UO1]
MSEIKISKEVSEIRANIKKLNLGQVSELIDSLKEEFNIQEQAVVQSTAASASEKIEEKGGNVSLKLLEIGANRIQIYKEIVNIIKEQKGEVISPIQAKSIADKEDKIILENIAKDKAEAIKKQLEEKGAKVEIK